MRRTKEITINDKRILIKELSQREIRDLFLSFTGKQGISPSDISGALVQKILGISWEEYLEFAPSEVEEILTALKDVNKSFLKIPDLLKSVGLGELWEQFKQSLKSDIFQKAISQSAPQVPTQ